MEASDHVLDKIYEAVHSAILSAWDPRQFVGAVESAWADVLAEEKERQLHQLRKMLNNSAP